MDSHMFALRDVVHEAIDEGRLGTPKFLRCIKQVADGDQLESAFDELVSLAVDWFGSEPVARHKARDDPQACLAEMLKWDQGQGALVIVASAPRDQTAHIDLMLVGSRGTLYHEE